jgi:hypothetical protein
LIFARECIRFTACLPTAKLSQIDEALGSPVGCGRPLTTLDIPGFKIREAVYDAAMIVPSQTHDWASLCLTIDGGYGIDWGRFHVECGPATRVLHAPNQVYGTRISNAGSHCLTVPIDPITLADVAGRQFDLERLKTVRRALGVCF